MIETGGIVNQFDDWPHRWFGAWKELGEGYEQCPSIHDFVDPDLAATYEKGRVAEYLETAHVVVTTSRLSFPCLLTGERFGGSRSYRTDGEWLWPDDLGHYVRHDVCLPTEFIATMKRNGFRPPAVSDEQVERLEWP